MAPAQMPLTPRPLCSPPSTPSTFVPWLRHSRSPGGRPPSRPPGFSCRSSWVKRHSRLDVDDRARPRRRRRVAPRRLGADPAARGGAEVALAGEEVVRIAVRLRTGRRVGADVRRGQHGQRGRGLDEGRRDGVGVVEAIGELGVELVLARRGVDAEPAGERRLGRARIVEQGPQGGVRLAQGRGAASRSARPRSGRRARRSAVTWDGRGRSARAAPAQGRPECRRNRAARRQPGGRMSGFTYAVTTPSMPCRSAIRASPWSARGPRRRRTPAGRPGGRARARPARGDRGSPASASRRRRRVGELGADFGGDLDHELHGGVNATRLGGGESTPVRFGRTTSW